MEKYEEIHRLNPNGAAITVAVLTFVLKLQHSNSHYITHTKQMNENF